MGNYRDLSQHLNASKAKPRQTMIFGERVSHVKEGRLLKQFIFLGEEEMSFLMERI